MASGVLARQGVGGKWCTGSAGLVASGVLARQGVGGKWCTGSAGLVASGVPAQQRVGGKLVVHQSQTGGVGQKTTASGAPVSDWWGGPENFGKWCTSQLGKLASHGKWHISLTGVARE